MGLHLRPLLIADEAEFRRIHAATEPEHFEFGLGLDDTTSWPAYLGGLEEMRRGNVQPGFVPATFLVAVVDDQIVGRTSIRQNLNEFLAHEGGHIGYGVAPEHRGLGHATEILRQSIIVARSHGVDRVLVTCNEDNSRPKPPKSSLNEIDAYPVISNTYTLLLSFSCAHRYV